MSGPQLDPLTILMPTASAPTTGSPRLAPPAAPLCETPTAAATGAARAQLDSRMTAVLRGAANGLGFEAAELWLLDDESTRLRRRVTWDSDAGAIAPAQDTRPLAGSDADVAALAGGAIVAETTVDAESLDLHRRCGSAIAVPASSDLTIHGILWLFGEEQRIDDPRVELAEIVATRLAVEIERDALLNDHESNRERLVDPEPTSLAAELPTHTLNHETLDAAGWIAADAGVAFHDWAELDDGRVLSLAGFVLDSPGVGSESSLIAGQTARVAARTLAAASADAGDLLTRVNETLWQSTASGEGVTLAVALIDSSGVGSYATAGPSVVVRVRAGETHSEPGDETPLGWDLDAEFAAQGFELGPRERLILATGDPRLTSPLDERALADAFRATTGDARASMTAAAGLKLLQNAGSDALAAAASIRRR